MRLRHPDIDGDPITVPDGCSSIDVLQRRGWEPVDGDVTDTAPEDAAVEDDQDPDGDAAGIADDPDHWDA